MNLNARYDADVINVHPGAIKAKDNDFVLDQKTRARIDLAARLYYSGVAPLILMNSGPGVIIKPDSIYEGNEDVTGLLQPGAGPRVCDLMVEYAVTNHDISRRNIITQPWSVDTVTVGFDAYLGTFAALGFQKEIFISNKTHQPVFQWVLEFMTGDKVKHIPSEGVHTRFDDYEGRAASQYQAIEKLKERFAGVQPGDIRAIETIIRKTYDPAVLVPNELRAPEHVWKG